MMHCYQYATMFLLIISMSSSHGKSTVNRLSGWSTWQSVSGCTATCGAGIVRRTRECIGNPKFCIGNKFDFMTCHAGCCAVTGEWCEWSTWSSCDFGIATRTRTRQCSCPVAREGGALCEGDAIETRQCSLNHAGGDAGDGQEVLRIGQGLLHGMESGDGSEGPTAKFDIPYYEDDPNIDYLPDDYEYEEYNTENDDAGSKTDQSHTNVPLTPIDYDCIGFRESMKDDQAQADSCCNLLKSYVANDDTLFNTEDPNVKSQLQDYDNSLLTSFQAPYELANDEEEDESQLDQQYDHYDDSPLTVPPAESGIVSLANISRLEQCISKNLESADAIIVGARSGGSCHLYGNILRTICCAYGSCGGWKNAGARAYCTKCRMENRCSCNGVPLSG